MDVFSIIAVSIIAITAFINFCLIIYNLLVKNNSLKKTIKQLENKQVVYSEEVPDLWNDHYEKYWKEGVEFDNKLDMYKVKKELYHYHMLALNTSQVYYYLSGGDISDPLTTVKIVKQAYDDVVKNFLDNIDKQYKELYNDKTDLLKQALDQYMKLSIEYYEVLKFHNESLKPPEARSAIFEIMRKHEFLHNSPIGRKLNLPNSLSLN